MMLDPLGLLMCNYTAGGVTSVQQKCLRVLRQLTSCMALSTKTFTSALANGFLPSCPLDGCFAPVSRCWSRSMASASRPAWRLNALRATSMGRHQHQPRSVFHQALCWLSGCMYKLSHDRLGSFSHPLKHKACKWEQCH